jgi:hypothetical protein
MKVGAVLPGCALIQPPQSSFKLWMMPRANLHAALMRRVYVMSMNQTSACAGPPSKEELHDAFTVAR